MTDDASDRETRGPDAPRTPAAIAHGGAGTASNVVAGCRRAVDAALEALELGGSAIDAAVAGVAVLEDDPSYNAGTGSRVRIDGETIQMDASVMGSDGSFGAVALIERVRNPVRVARVVLDSPELLIAGDGATRLAHRLGFPDYDPSTEAARAHSRRVRERLLGSREELPAGWRDFDWREHWNFPRSLSEAGLDESDVGSDTVGVAVRTVDGAYGVALSTGGNALTLRGRVGDVPIPGAGLFAGGHGAVAATGSGERIAEAGLARRVHRWLGRGMACAQAAKRAVRELHNSGSIGIVVIGEAEMAAAANRPMPWAARALGSSRWEGTGP